MNASEENLNKIHFYLLKKFKSYCWISGGAIADAFESKTPRDIDIYFASDQAKENAANILKEDGAKVIQVYPMGVKLKYKNIEIDLVYLDNTPQKVFEKFDYTIACAAIDKHGEFFSHPDFFEHLGDKKLCYIGGAPSKGAAHYTNKVKRLRKYMRKGYKLDDKSFEGWLESMIFPNKKPNKNTEKKH
mgnify:CR=1 FL=1|tara:strand:+ start:1878 stop:2441 length:564 start_codon:yes stop_codon:yes gene_type:complete